MTIGVVVIFFEVLKKRRKVGPVLQKTWDRVGSNLIYPQIAESDPDQKLIYFGMVAYATVFESATSEGMSSSGAHYLARMQIGKYKLGASITKKVEDVFSGTEDDLEQENAAMLRKGLAQIVAIVNAGEGEVEAILRNMGHQYKKITIA